MDNNKPAYEVRVDPVKNRIYICFWGYLPDTVIKAAVDEIIAGTKKLTPGFDVITDISTFKPASKKGSEEITRGQEFINQHSPRRILRVVDAKSNLISQVQFDRLSETSYDKKVQIIHVESIAQAEKLLASQP